MNQDIVIWAVGSIASLIGIYVRMETKMKELDLRVRSLEKTDKIMVDKLDKIMEMISDIRLELKDKANRQN